MTDIAATAAGRADSESVVHSSTSRSPKVSSMSTGAGNEVAVYFGLTKQRLLAGVVVSVFSAAVAGFLALSAGGEQYTSSATVFVSALDIGDTNGGTGELSGVLVAALNLDVVQQRAAETSGVDGRIFDIEVSGTPGDPVLGVAVSGPDDESTEALAGSVIRAAIALVGDQRLSSIASAEALAAESAQGITGELAALTASSGSVDPTAELVSAESLREALARESTNNGALSAAGRADLADRIAELDTAIASLIPVATDYERLVRSAERSGEVLDDLARQRILSESFAAEAATASAVIVSPAVQRSPIVGAAPPAIVAGALAAIIWWLLMQLGRNQTPQRTRPSERPQTGLRPAQRQAGESSTTSGSAEASVNGEHSDTPARVGDTMSETSHVAASEATLDSESEGARRKTSVAEGAPEDEQHDGDAQSLRRQRQREARRGQSDGGNVKRFSS